MNKANLKSYAPQARLDFIAAVTARANLLGITSKGVSPVDVRGDVAIIEGREWPAKIAGQRHKLIVRITRHGFEHSMEEAAYTWFNRFAAMRFMELHDYLGHGWRVLSSRDGGLPEILQHAGELSLPDLSRERATELQLAGNQDNELYKLLIVAQCNALSRSMPFLFERIEDETELLLPENLLRTDSIVAKLVSSVPEEDWRQIESIGWLYQFYISERKDEVIGKVVKSEDIPAATQLFTPSWIVQYMVQNTVGRLWAAANPASELRGQWPYYIEPAGQESEAQSIIDSLLRERVAENGGSLNPESITVLDPACGSGHILVEAYDLLKGIYLERGYRPRDIPRLILEKNLYGIDIDDRAAQLAGFALMMKARADDRRLFDEPIALNVVAMQGSDGVDAEALASAVIDAAIAIDGGSARSGQLFGEGPAPSMHASGLRKADFLDLVEFFAHAKTFGSLLEVPLSLASKLGEIGKLLRLVQEKGDRLAQLCAGQIAEDYLAPALLLEKRYDAVVANPPYMGGKYIIPLLKSFLKDNFKGYEKDLFSAFMIRNLSMAKPSGRLGFMSPFVWMFISSYEELREHFISRATLESLVQLEYSGFDGATVPICTFTLAKSHIPGFVGSFIRLSDFRGAELQSPKALEAIADPSCGWRHSAKPDEFKKIPGVPIAYWMSPSLLRKFSTLPSLGSVCPPKKGLVTSDNTRFLKMWHEVAMDRVELAAGSREQAVASGKKWFPINCGGAYRKWFGNADTLINWEEDGREIIGYAAELYGSASRQIQNTAYYFREAITWSNITSGAFGARYSDQGFVFGAAGTAAFPIRPEHLLPVVAFLNSNVAAYILKIFNPTLNFVVNDIASLPFDSASIVDAEVKEAARECVELARADWNVTETSWGFQSPPMLGGRGQSLPEAWEAWRSESEARIERTKVLEERMNAIFIQAYGLEGELAASVPLDQIALARADREKDAQRVVSYAIGCMMGRYCLGEPGLSYAGSGNDGFDPARSPAFPADADGILPITDEMWFPDDAANRMAEFAAAAWGPEAAGESLIWLAESLGAKAGESPGEAIRRHLAERFFKGHAQAYRKRPIYWLFSSGRLGGFQALVYMHRYGEGTLSRMRSAYVLPLSAKFMGRLEMLGEDFAKETAAAGRTKIQKQIEALRKKQSELLAFDEKLRHFADKRITIDLDDGVKANYAKFGDLVAESKAIAGGSDD